jgi:hypothetical protein
VRNAEKGTEPRGRVTLGLVAARHHQDAEGEKTAREAVEPGFDPLDGSRGEQTLEGSERFREGFPEK